MDISDFAEHGRTRTRACTEKEFVSLIFQVIKQELYFLFAYLRDAVHRVRRPPTFGKRWITHVGCKFYDPFESIYCYQDGGSKARTCKYDAAGPCFTGRAVHCWMWKSWHTHTRSPHVHLDARTILPVLLRGNRHASKWGLVIQRSISSVFCWSETF